MRNGVIIYSAAPENPRGWLDLGDKDE